jgi:hypothetical protein
MFLQTTVPGTAHFMVAAPGCHSQRGKGEKIHTTGRVNLGETRRVAFFGAIDYRTCSSKFQINAKNARTASVRLHVAMHREGCNLKNPIQTQTVGLPRKIRCGAIEFFASSR